MTENNSCVHCFIQINESYETIYSIHLEQVVSLSEFTYSLLLLLMLLQYCVVPDNSGYKIVSLAE